MVPPLSISGRSSSSTVKINKGNMDVYYDGLPKLPLPPLKQTLQRFLAVSKALLNKDDYLNTVKVSHNSSKFGKAGGEAERLHTLLEQRAEKLKNWLSDWWLNYAYLEQRCPLPINVSPGLTFPKQNYVGFDGQLEFASRLIVALIRYKNLIDNRQLVPDTASKVPLDMSQYDVLFGTTRIPGLTNDTLRYGVNETSPVHHVAIAYRGEFYKVVVMDSVGRSLSYAQILSSLRNTLRNEHRTYSNPVGVLTSDDRTVWASNYAKLAKNSSNRKMLDVIERALCLICIDSKFGVLDESEFAGQLLHGGGPKVNGCNRWFDKCLQFIVAPEGFCGLTYEHSPAEGPPVAALMDFVVDNIKKSDSVRDADGEREKDEVLIFQLDDEDRRAIQKSAEKFDIIAKDLEVIIYRFKHFGKEFAKSQRVSPDSVVQLALQMAFYKIHSECPATYETGTLRRFDLGRTDTIRLPTLDSLNFILTNSDTKTNRVAKAEAFRKAVQSHKEYTAAACSGNGIDRHLLGLKLIAIENGVAVPMFYSSKAYETALHFKLSTSQVSAKSDSCMMFGPMYPDCYGICYNPKNHQINFSVSAFKSYPATSSVKFASVLESSLLQIRDFLSEGTKSKL